jgi:hypothetical protein
MEGKKMESQFSDQELHDVALGYKPTTKKVQNLCGELLSTRAALSALQEATNNLVIVYSEQGDSLEFADALNELKMLLPIPLEEK